MNAYANRPDTTELAIAISGGKSSAWLAIKCKEAWGSIPLDVPLVFTNTGFELRETLTFLHRLEDYLQHEIIMLEFDSRAPCKFRRVNHNSASMDGEPFLDLFFTELLRRDGTVGLRALPNPSKGGRTCSANLKTKTSHRYLRSLGWSTRYYTAVGYREDERARYDRHRVQELSKGSLEGGIYWCPMIDEGVQGLDVIEGWEKMPFQLGLEAWEGNCTFCFMKSEWKIKAMMQKHPHLLAHWLRLEATARDRPHLFRKDRPSLAQLWAAVQAGDMTSKPQSLRIQCEACTG